MKLLTLFIIELCVVYGRPQINVESVQAALTRSFSVRKDYQNLDLPPIQSSAERTYKHPFNFNLTNDGSGNYYFGYNTFSGTDRYEIGELKNAGTDNEIQSVRGQYIDRYFTSNGYTVVRTIGYIADENGYQPFLIDISVQQPMPAAAPPAPGAPKGPKKEISDAAKASLIGGGIGK